MRGVYGYACPYKEERGVRIG